MHEKEQDRRCFAWSTITWQVSLVRLSLLWGRKIPSEWSKWIRSSAFQSILVDPAFSVQTFREASAIRKLFPPHRFADAYQGYRIPIPPLFLAVMEPLLGVFEYDLVLIGVFLLVVDYCIAWNLEQIGRALVQKARPRETFLEHKMPESIHAPLAHVFGIKFGMTSSEVSNQVLHADTLPCFLALLYYLSPVPLLSGNVLLCLQNIPFLCLAMAIRQASSGQSGTLVWSGFWLAMTSYLSLHNILYAIPIALLFRRQGKNMVVFLGVFVSLSVFLQFVNVLIVGPQDYWPVFLATHGATFALSNLAPSLSTLWYLGMELFGRFSRYLTLALAGLPYVVVAPTVIRLHAYPEALVSVDAGLHFSGDSSIVLTN